MKKLLVLLMIFVMSFAMIGCGGDKDGDNPDGAETASEGMEAGDVGDSADDDGASDEGKIDVENLIVDDDTQEKYDFGFTVSNSFGMSEVLKKIDYTKLSAQQSKLEDMMKEAAEAHLSGNYSIFSDYEEESVDSIDKLVYVIGMEDDDTEKSFLETGAYHSTDGDKNYQYTVYTSENFYKADKSGIAAVLKEIKSAYGITVSQSKVEKAAQKVLKKATETDDYYSYYETKDVKGSGYSEKVSFAVEGFVTEEGEIGFYISVERERCYN